MHTRHDLRSRWDALINQAHGHDAHDACAVTYCRACWWHALETLCGDGVGAAEALDDESRCAVCASPLGDRLQPPCARGACATTPLPKRFYAPARVCVEYQRSVVDDGSEHRFYVAALS